jgi:hypothetical protein
MSGTVETTFPGQRLPEDLFAHEFAAAVRVTKVVERYFKAIDNNEGPEAIAHWLRQLRRTYAGYQLTRNDNG